MIAGEVRFCPGERDGNGVIYFTIKKIIIMVTKTTNYFDKKIQI